MNELSKILSNQFDELSDKQVEFLNVHTNIVSSGVSIVNSVIVLAENLKIMKDKELYKEAGFETFEKYSEEACGIKRSQAYKYINVLENLGAEFVHSNGHLGITKLGILSSLDKEEREVIQAEVSVFDVTVSELKEEIKKLNNDYDESIKKLKEKDDSLDKAKEKINKLNGQIKNIKSQIQIEEKIIDNPDHIKKIESLEQLIKIKDDDIVLKNSIIDDFKSQKILSASTELAEFKILFEDIQSKILKMKTLINLVPEDKKDGCVKALKKVGELLC